MHKGYGPFYPLRLSGSPNRCSTQWRYDSVSKLSHIQLTATMLPKPPTFIKTEECNTRSFRYSISGFYQTKRRKRLLQTQQAHNGALVALGGLSALGSAEAKSQPSVKLFGSPES